MEMNNHEISVEVLRRMEAEKKRRGLYKRKLLTRLSIAACLVFVAGASVGVPLFFSNNLLKESTGMYAASLSDGDPEIGFIALISIAVITIFIAVVLLRRKKKGRGSGRNH